MNEQSARSLYEQEINNQVSALLPNGAGPMNETRFRHALELVAKRAFTSGESYALLSLMDIDQALAEINQRMTPRKISKRRLQAIATERHERFGIGAIIGGVWLFRPSEIDGLIPGESGRPVKNAR